MGSGCVQLALVAFVYLPSVGLGVKFLGLPLTVGYLAALSATVALLFAIERSERWATFVERREAWFAATWIGLMAVLLAVLYPMAQSGAFGRGSDRDDALMVGIGALLAGQYPYYGRVYRGDVLSPLPGSLLLGMPFHLLGSVVAQNFAVAVAGAVSLARCLQGIRVRWPLLALLSIGNLAFIQDYVTGGDFAIAAIYVGMAFLLCVRSLDRPDDLGMALAAVFLGLVVCTRPIYPLAIVVLTAHVLRQHGWGRAVRFALMAFGAAATVTLPFYLYDPANFTPLHVLRLLPPPMRYLNVLLPLLALVVAVLPAFRDFGRWGLLGVLVASLAVILGPGAIVRSLRYPLSYAYVVPVALLGAAALLGGLAERLAAARRPAGR